MDKEIEHHVKLPQKFRTEEYLKAFELALYRLVFVEDSEVNTGCFKDQKKGAVTTRIYLTEKGDENFETLKNRLKTSKVNTALHAFNHIDENQKLYLI